MCVLFVSEYDVNHATIGTSNGLAEMEFYVRTKMGSPIESVELQEQLKQGLLEGAILELDVFKYTIDVGTTEGRVCKILKFPSAV